MFETIGAIAGGPVSADQQQRRSLLAERRTFQPVHRHSRLAGREGVFWRGTSRKDVQAIVLAAERFDLANKKPGDHNGPLGLVAIQVLRYLANLIDFRTGRLDPSIETLMLRLVRSRDAIVTALKNLRAHGFLDWLRRYVPTGGQGQRGPQVQQTSNAYRLLLPPAAARLLGRYFQAAPLPDDVAQAQADQAAVIEAHRATLQTDQRLLFDDHPFAEQLGALFRNMQARKQRESERQTESLSIHISKRE